MSNYQDENEMNSAASEEETETAPVSPHSLIQPSSSMRRPRRSVAAFAARRPVVYRIALTASMTALSVVLCRFVGFAPEGTGVRLEIGFLPVAFLAQLLGPLYSGIAYLLADLLGSLVSGHAINFFITGTKLLFGVLMGLFFYKKNPPSFLRVALAFLVIGVLVDFLLMSPIFIYMYGYTVGFAFIMRAVNAAVTYPIRVFTYYYLAKAITKYVK